MLECFVFTRISKISLLMHPSSINRLKRNIYLGLLKFFGGNAYSNAKELTYSMLTHLLGRRQTIHMNYVCNDFGNQKMNHNFQIVVFKLISDHTIILFGTY